MLVQIVQESELTSGEVTNFYRIWFVTIKKKFVMQFIFDSNCKTTIHTTLAQLRVLWYDYN